MSDKITSMAEFYKKYLPNDEPMIEMLVTKEEREMIMNKRNAYVAKQQESK